MCPPSSLHHAHVLPSIHARPIQTLRKVWNRAGHAMTRQCALCRTLDALPGLRRGVPPRWGIVRSLAMGQRIATWSARAGQTTRDISVRVSQTSTTVIACAPSPHDACPWEAVVQRQL